MAPNVTVHFWNANDINNATPILEITDEDEFFRGFKITPDLYALGGWELTLARRVGFALFDSGAVQPEVFVRFLIHAWSDTEYFFGGLLQKRNQVVVARDEQGEEIFTFGGPGPKAYMDRYRLGIEQLTGTGWNLDLDNGVWNWTETATAGRVLNRVVAEDAAQADPSLPDLTKTFTDANDSSSTPWTNDVAGPNEYEIPIGESLLSIIFDLEDLSDLYTTINLGTVSAPLYRLEAWQTYGDDVTGTSPGVGVGLLREGLNIANDSLTVEGVGIRKCTHVIVEGKDGAWAVAVRPTWSSGDYIKWGKIEYTRSSNETILERAGLRWLRRQDNGEKQITVEIAPGASEATGYYFPNPDGPLWLGNTVTLDTAEDGSTHTPLDFNNEDELLTGLDLTLGPAGDTATADKEAKSWDVKVRLNWERAGFAGAPDQTSAATGNNPCKCPALCHPFVEGTPDSIEKYYSGGSDDPGGDAINWTGILQNQGSAGQGALGSDAYFFKSNAPNHYQDSWAANAGESWTITGYIGCPSDGQLQLVFTSAAPGTAGSALAPSVLVTHTLSPVQPGHSHAPEWTGWSAGPFTAPPGTTSAAFGRTDSVNFDETYCILNGVPAENPYAGTDGRAARCDHVHPASEIVFEPDYTVLSDNVQDAIIEVAQDAADALADAISAIGGAGFIDWFVVTDPTYGAVGDGVTDDTAAIQAAIDAAEVAGGVVYFPVGQYLISSALTVNPGAAGQSVTLRGAGFNGSLTDDYGSVIIQGTANTTAISAGANCYHLFVEDLKITGPTGSSSYGISADRNVHCTNVWIEGFWRGYGLLGTSAVQSYYSKNVNLTTYGAADTGVYLLAGVNNADFFGCRMNANGVNGMFIGGCWGVRLFGGAIEGNGTYGARIDSAGSGASGTTQATHSVLFSGTYFESTATDIRVGHSSAGTVHNVTIDSCQFISTATNNITGQYFDGLTLRNNIYQGGKSKVSFTAPATNVTIEGMEFGAGSYGTLPAATIRLDPSQTLTPVATGTALAAGSGPDVAYKDHVHTNSVIGGVTVSGTPASGDHIIASSSSAAAWGASSGGGGGVPNAILLESGHAVPFTFDEILQNSDGSDFLWASE